MKVGVALGSGAARGLAHIGFLQALDEAGLEVAAISGSSMGALVGALYASGVDMKKMGERISSMEWKIFTEFFGFTLSRSGFVDGTKIEKFIKKETGGGNIESMKIPFCCVATDFLTGEEVVFDSGSIVDAVRASIAFPGVITPRQVDGRYLIDGGVVNPVPANRLPDDCDVRIAVNVGPFVAKDDLLQRYGNGNHGIPAKKAKAKSSGIRRFGRAMMQKIGITETNPAPSAIELLVQTVSIMQSAIAESALSSAKNLVIARPELSDYIITDFEHADSIIEGGYESGKRIAAEVLQS